MEVLTRVLSDYAADRRRVYLTGVSYGGFGVWYMASRHPESFAAIAPIVAWGHPDLMAPIAREKLPVWSFSGGKDGMIHTGYFYAGMNRLMELGHATARFTTHQDMQHDVWNRVYAGTDIYDWFLSHEKKGN
jgi:predicted peptidase